MRIIFYFETGGDVTINGAEATPAQIREAVGAGWNGTAGQMFTVSDREGFGTLVNLSKVRAVEIKP